MGLEHSDDDQGIEGEGLKVDLYFQDRNLVPPLSHMETSVLDMAYVSVPQKDVDHAICPINLTVIPQVEGGRITAVKIRISSLFDRYPVHLEADLTKPFTTKNLRSAFFILRDRFIDGLWELLVGRAKKKL